MPYNSRQVREYAGGSIGGILRKGYSNASANSFSTSTTGSASFGGEVRQIDLLVFGYACKVFRDDDKAREIDQGKHLIPWMGDSSLKIDRYDVRGALYDLSPHEVPAGGYGNRLDYLTAEEQRAEQLCEEERYFYLYNNEEQHILEQEEELKRFRQESVGSSCYNQVGLQYNEISASSNEEIHGPKREEFSNSPICEEADQAYVLPNNFVVPPSIQLPETMKQHAIIEKTARFIASQGIQMEILLKAKQSNNLQFEFLTQNSLLNPYYKFIHNAIKEGTYPMEQTSKESAIEDLCQGVEGARQDEVSNIEESVPAIIRPVITVPTIKYVPSANCAYTQLISKIKGVPLPEVIDEHRNAAAAAAAAEATDKATSSTSNAVTPDGENFTPVLLQYNGQTYITASADNESTNLQSDSVSKSASTTNSPPKVEILKNSSALMLAQNYSSDSESDTETETKATANPPPPALKLTFPIPMESLRNIIDKTASYVIKNGRQFEETLRAKSEERFTFLLPENEFYPYYMYKITGDPDAASIEQKTKRAAAVAAALMSRKKLLKGIERNLALAHVSFSIKSKDDQLQPTLPQDASDEDEENAGVQDKQLSNSTDQQLRTVPDHVKKAIQLVESQLMARNAQLAAVAGVANVVLPCNISTAIRSRFDVDYNGQMTKSTGFSGNAITNAEMERNAIYEQQQQNRHKELKRAEEKVKDKLAQIAREKLGGLISKEKQLQLERKRKAMAFLNQIKGSSENELTPDKKSLNDGNASDDNSDSSVHSIPITSYGPDANTDDEEDQQEQLRQGQEQSPPIPPPPPPPPIPTVPSASTSELRTPSPKPSANNGIINITADVTLSDDDDVQLVSETKAIKRPRLFTVPVHNHNLKESRQRRSRSRSRTRDARSSKVNTFRISTTSRDSSVESIDTTDYSAIKRSHKSCKTKKSTTKSHRKKSKSKSKSKPKIRTRSRSRSSRRSSRRSYSCSPSPPLSKIHVSSHSHSTYRTSHSRYSRSLSVELRPSPVSTKNQGTKRSKHSRSPQRKEKRRKREH